MVNGETFGLTAGHPFKAHFDHRSGHNKPHDPDPDVRNLDDEDIRDASGELFVFNDDENSRRSFASTSGGSLHDSADVPQNSINDTTHAQRDISKINLSSVKWSQPYNAVVPLSTPNNPSSSEEPRGDGDWALLEMPPDSTIMLPNKVACIHPQHDAIVQKTVSGPAHGEITIAIAGIGVQLGCLHSSPVTLKVNESILDVQLITLEHILRKCRLYLPYDIFYVY